MKKIKIIFNGLGYENINQANVIIYDNENNVVYRGKTYNNKLIINLEENQVYRLVATSLNDVIKIPFYVRDDEEYIFSFSYNVITLNRIITFLLNDYYYNLPIERGEIYVQNS